MRSPPARRALIDTDPGLDDLLALALACASPELRVVAITTLAGNLPLDTVSANAARFCSLAGLDVPLGRGAKRPLALAPGDAAWVHGPDGRGGVELPEPVSREAVDASELIGAIAHNIENPSGEAFLQRKVAYDNIGTEALVELRRRVRAAGAEFVQAMNTIFAGYDLDRNPQAPGGNRSRAVLGVYYFDEDFEEMPPPATGKAAGRRKK